MWVDACRVQLRATPNTVNNARPEGITGGALSVAVPRLAPRDPGTAVTPLPGTGNAVSPLDPMENSTSAGTTSIPYGV